MMRLLMLAAFCVTSAAGQDGWVAERLSQLAPDSPDGYLLLAEEIVSEPEPAFSDVELARRLYVLAFTLSENMPGISGGVQGPACFGLAALENSQDRRRWLYALAERVDARYQPPEWRSHDGQGDRSQARTRLAEAVGEIRSGRGRFALETMEEPRIAGLLETFGPVIDGLGNGVSVDRLRTLARQHDTPECGGRRAIPEGGPSRRRFILCPENDGNPGPVLTIDEYLAYVRFEALLLESEPDSWAAELAGAGRAPLRDPEPEELSPMFGIDSAQSIWRDGSWIAPPDA